MSNVSIPVAPAPAFGKAASYDEFKKQLAAQQTYADSVGGAVALFDRIQSGEVDLADMLVPQIGKDGKPIMENGQPVLTLAMGTATLSAVLLAPTSTGTHRLVGVFRNMGTDTRLGADFVTTKRLSAAIKDAMPVNETKPAKAVRIAIESLRPELDRLKALDGKAEASWYQLPQVGSDYQLRLRLGHYQGRDTIRLTANASLGVAESNATNAAFRQALSSESAQAKIAAMRQSAMNS